MSAGSAPADPKGSYPPGALAAYAAEHGLTPVGIRPPLKVYLAQTWQRRHFIVSLAASKAYIRNQGGYLGQLWAIITPALWACVGFAALATISCFALTARAPEGAVSPEAAEALVDA